MLSNMRKPSMSQNDPDEASHVIEKEMGPPNSQLVPKKRNSEELKRPTVDSGDSLFVQSPNLMTEADSS